MGRIEQVEPAGINAYNRIPKPQGHRGHIHDYPWEMYQTKGFIQRNKNSSCGTTIPKTAEEIAEEITKTFGEGNYIYAACKTRLRREQFLVMSLLEKKVE